MSEILSYSFFQRALFAGLLAGGLCGLLSVYIISKQMAFIGQGISHAAFGGVSLGLLLSIDPLIPAAFFAVIMALGVAWLSSSGRTNRDTIIGILMASSMALGVVFLSLAKGYKGSVISYLFGNILAVTNKDLIWLTAVSLISVIFVLLFRKELTFFLFDERIARISGIPINLIQIGLLICIAFAVIASVHMVGIILVTAFLVIPGAIGQTLGRRLYVLFVISLLSGILSVIIGLFVSYLLNIPSGATIVLVLTFFFGMARIANSLFSK